MSMKILPMLTAAFTFGLMHTYVVPKEAAEEGQQIPPGAQRVWVTVGERRFPITLADNAASRAFAAQLPLALKMPDLNGNEKHAKLPKALPQTEMNPATIRAGDLMLWGKDTLVIFYESFKTPYSYTRLGAVEDSSALTQALGRGEVSARFSKD
jgi:hypothetical protein